MAKRNKKIKKSVSRGLRKTKPSKGMLMDALFLLAGFAGGNLAANYATKLSGEKLVGAFTPLAGILATNFVKMPSENPLKAGLLISSVIQLKKTDMFPKNQYLDLALSGSEPEIYLVNGTNENPLGEYEPEEKFLVSGNVDPLD